MTAQVVTANRLVDGLVVYLDGAGAWSERIEEARVVHGDENGAALLAFAESPDQGILAVGPYLMGVAEDGDAPRPLSNREMIRAKGPTVRLDLGKQAAPA